MDRTLENEFRLFIQQLRNSGGVFATTLQNTANTVSDASQDGIHSIQAEVKKRTESARSLEAYKRSMQMGTKSSETLNRALTLLTSQTERNAERLSGMSDAYTLARDNMENRASSLYKTWDEMNSSLPKVLSDQVRNINVGIADKLQNFEDVLKFDQYIAVQQEFLKNYQDNGHKLERAQLDLLIGVQQFGESIGDDFSKNIGGVKTGKKLKALTDAIAAGKDPRTIRTLTTSFENSMRAYQRSMQDGGDAMIEGLYTNINRFTRTVADAGATIANTSRVLESTVVRDVIGRFGRMGPALEEGIRTGFGGGAINNILIGMRGAFSAMILDGIGSLLASAKNDFVASSRSESRNDVEFQRIDALQLLVNPQVLADAQKQQIQFANSMMGGLTEHIATLKQSGENFNQLTGYDGAANLKLANSTFQATTGLDGVRISSDNASKITNRFAKQLQLTSKYTGESVEEIANNVAAMGESTEIQRNVTMMSVKQREAYATNIAQMYAQAKVMGLSATQTKEFVDAMTGGKNNMTDAAKSAAALENYMSQFGQDLSNEQKDRVRVLASKADSGQLLTPAEQQDLDDLTKALHESQQNSPLVRDYQLAADRAADLEAQLTRAKAEGRLGDAARIAAIQDSERLNATVKGTQIRSMQDRFLKDATGIQKQIMSTSDRNAPIEARRASEQAQERLKTEQLAVVNPNKSIDSPILGTSEVMLKLISSIDALNDTIVGSVIKIGVGLAGLVAMRAAFTSGIIASMIASVGPMITAAAGTVAATITGAGAAAASTVAATGAAAASSVVATASGVTAATVGSVSAAGLAATTAVVAGVGVAAIGGVSLMNDAWDDVQAKKEGKEGPRTWKNDWTEFGKVFGIGTDDNKNVTAPDTKTPKEVTPEKKTEAGGMQDEIEANRPTTSGPSGVELTNMKLDLLVETIGKLISSSDAGNGTFSDFYKLYQTVEKERIANASMSSFLDSAKKNVSAMLTTK